MMWLVWQREACSEDVEIANQLQEKYRGKLDNALSFADAEIFALPFETRKEIFDSSEFDYIRNYVKMYSDQEKKTFDEMLRKSHVDVYPEEGKNSNGFELSAPDPAVMPYIHMNYRGTFDDVSTFSHGIASTLN